MHASNDLHILTAQSSDLPHLVRLVGGFRDHLGTSEPTDLQLEASLATALNDPTFEFCMAFLDEQAVGYTQTRFYFSIWKAATVAFVDDLFVFAAARRHRVGRALLDNAFGRARHRGCVSLELCTNERNLASQRLYRSAGMQPEQHELWGDGREIKWVLDL